MAQALMTIEDPWGTVLVQAICKNYNYQASFINPVTGEVTPNPETAQAFAIRMRVQFNKDNLKAFLVPDLAKADRAAKIAEIDAIVMTIVPVV